MRTYRLNTENILLPKDGAILCGPVSGVRSPLRLAETDFLILSEFFQARQPRNALDNLAKFIVTPDAGMKQAALRKVLAKIEGLIRSGVLISSARFTPTQIEHSSLLDADDNKNDICQKPAEVTIPLKLYRNFAIKISPEGFLAWSPRARQYILIPNDLVAPLLAFRVPKLQNQVLGKYGVNEVIRKRIEKALDRFITHGLVVSHRIPTDSMGVVQQTTGSNAIYDTSYSQPLDLNSIKASGKTPVYFVPHMPDHFPHALGMIRAFVKQYKDGLLNEMFEFLPLVYMSKMEEFQNIHTRFGPGIWFFSNYMWSIDINSKLSEQVKRVLNPENICVHGGPSTPAYPGASKEFMEKNTHVDISVHGEGEIAAAELLEAIGKGLRKDYEKLSMVDGITFAYMDGNERRLKRTGDRGRVRELDGFPSPFLDGTYDHYGIDVHAAIIESNRGCPFKCTFCDWGSATAQKVRKFDIDRVRQEIEWVGSRKIPVIWLADANFGMYERDIEIAQIISDTKAEYGYPSDVVVNYTKNANKYLVEIVKIFTKCGICSEGIISIQTTDEVTLKDIRRSNIKTETYDDLTEVFRDEGLPLSTDLMYGLPGMTNKSFDRDLQRYFDKDVDVKAYPTQLLPNSPMADPDYMEKYQIKVDKQHFITGTYSFNYQQIADMEEISTWFNIADGYSVLRCVLRYLQWDCGVDALDFLHALLFQTRKNPARFPAITWCVRFFGKDQTMPGGWKSFYDEIAEFAKSEYGIERDSAFDTVLHVNELLMPENCLDYPLTVDLKHDIEAWFTTHINQDNSSPEKLSGFLPATLEVTDKFGLSRVVTEIVQYDVHQIFWSLSSPISRRRSAPSFMARNN